MGLRDTINKNPSAVTAVTAVVIVGTLIYMAIQLGVVGGDDGPGVLRGFDDGPAFIWEGGDTFRTGTRGDLMRVGPDDPDRPIIARRVRPSADSEPVVWYLERLDPAAPEIGGFQRVIRRPDDRQWHPMGSGEADDVLFDRPGGDAGVEVLPDFP